ncbi:MAG: DUF1573 domain-containing protein [Bacteroidales bacterium]|nr:DUF1573 domain-containing protein [Bacteroidales bacterium]
MKRLIVILLVIVALSSNAQNNIKLDGPKISFSTLEYNYDTIVKNSDGCCSFEFFNDGSEPLIITSAFSSCGCTVPSWPQKPILPGEKGTIDVKYNTEKEGDFQKLIIVKSNSVEKPKSILRIKGVVVKNIRN